MGSFVLGGLEGANVLGNNLHGCNSRQTGGPVLTTLIEDKKC
jgi:hypothetical protein